jgi:esterase/lipase superfamily enzyme
LTYGTATVFIPKSHVPGSTGSRLHSLTGKDAPLTFEDSKVMDESLYWESLKKQLLKLPLNGKVVLVFIHGYNTDFKEAAIRTAQLWADLGLDGVPSFFSWPSKGSMGAYTVDEATIDYSEKYLEQYLVTLRGQVGQEQPIHVIAHSMGNRALLRVAARLQNSIKLGQIILAAPDVDLDLFQQLAHAYPRISERTTLYVSTSDKPVNFSGFFHDVERVGAPPRFAYVAGIDTVEVKAKTGLLELGHSYFAEYKDLLEEIGSLITNNPHASKLFVGKREDRRVSCKPDDSGRTKESCWRIVTSK